MIWTGQACREVTFRGPTNTSPGSSRVRIRETSQRVGKKERGWDNVGRRTRKRRQNGTGELKKMEGSGGFGDRPCWTCAAVALSLQHKFHSGFSPPWHLGTLSSHSFAQKCQESFPWKRDGEPKSDIIYFSRVHLPHKIHHSDFLTILPLSDMLIRDSAPTLRKSAVLTPYTSTQSEISSILLVELSQSVEIERLFSSTESCMRGVHNRDMWHIFWGTNVINILIHSVHWRLWNKTCLLNPAKSRILPSLHFSPSTDLSSFSASFIDKPTCSVIRIGSYSL